MGRLFKRHQQRRKDMAQWQRSATKRTGAYFTRAGYRIDEGLIRRGRKHEEYWKTLQNDQYTEILARAALGWLEPFVGPFLDQWFPEQVRAVYEEAAVEGAQWYADQPPPPLPEPIYDYEYYTDERRGGGDSGGGPLMTGDEEEDDDEEDGPKKQKREYAAYIRSLNKLPGVFV